MGFFDRSIGQGRTRQKQAVIDEARHAGATVLEVVELSDEVDAANAALGSSLKALFGGRAQFDHVQVFRLHTQGWIHTYAQPYSGLVPLPGEHHGVLHGSLAAPAILRPGGLFGGAKWDPSAWPDVARYLDSAAHLASVVRATEWEWGTGLSVVRLEWGVQLRSLGNGATHVVMQAGRYGGLTTYEVGFSQWLRLCQILPSFLQQAAHPAQAFIEAPRWDAPAMAVMQGQEIVPASPPVQPAPSPAGTDVRIDYAGTIGVALTPHVGRKVWVGTIPAKQLGNLRAHVIPPQLCDSPVIAAIDLTMFGSAKDAIVVTPTHFVVKEFEQATVLDLPAIRAVNGPRGLTSGTIEIVVDRLGALAIPVGTSLEPVMALLHAIADANAGAGKMQVSAFVGEAPQQVSMEQAQAMAQRAQAAMRTDDVDAKINAAAQLLLTGQYQAAIDAYQAIAREHPETTGTCYGQVGAALFFLQQYPQAIAWYEAAKQYGADVTAMNENIAEAQAYLR